jgi:hypothetical protein
MVAADLARLTAPCGGPAAIPGGPHPIGPYLSLEASAGGGQRVLGDIFVLVDRLGMLSQVIQT